MLGKALLRQVLNDLDTAETSDEYADRHKLFDCLDRAACMFVRETGVLHASASITAVADTQAYDLPPDFVNLYMKDRCDRFYVRYTDADSNDSHPRLCGYDRIFRAHNTDSQDYPCAFAIIDKATKETVISGSADAAGDQASDGSCVLQDDSMLFTTTNRVHQRDIVYNTTDGSHGIVVEVTDATHLKIAMFEGTDNDIDQNDAYIIQPAAEYQLVLDYPSLTAGHAITVPYICLPSPVYHDTGWWRFNQRHCRAIASGAAALFKLPKREFDESAVIGGLFQQEIERYREERAIQILAQKHTSRRR